MENVLASLKIKNTLNTSKYLAEKLKSLILSEELPCGYTFPSENILCKQIGVGRSTLREAYKELESFGYISRNKSGTVVNSLSEIKKKTPFISQVKMSSFSEIIEFRKMFESELAYLAAERADDSNISNLQFFLEKMRESKDIIELTKYDIKFHKEIAQSSRNSLLIDTMGMVSDVFKDFVFKAFKMGDEQIRDKAILAHEEILKSIQNKMPKEAQSAMRAHVESVSNSIIKNINKGLS